MTTLYMRALNVQTGIWGIPLTPFLLINTFFKSITNCDCCFLKYDFTKGFIIILFTITHSVKSIWVLFPLEVKMPVQCPFILLFSISNSQRSYGFTTVIVKVVGKPSLAYSTNCFLFITSVLLKSLRHWLYFSTAKTVSQTLWISLSILSFIFEVVFSYPYYNGSIYPLQR